MIDRLAVAALLLSAGLARADEPSKPDGTAAAPAPAAQGPAAKPDLTVAKPAATGTAAEPPAPPSNRGLAILEVVGVNLTLNISGRVFKGEDSYDSTFQTWWDNIAHVPWEYDTNAFATNQFAHPYEGSLFMVSGRSLGLGFWESFAYTALGSWIWETGMEIHPPSVNDQITTTVGGAFLGEVLFRLSTKLLDETEPGAWRELGAAAIAPMHGFNRALYGDKYRDRRLSGYPLSAEFTLGLTVGGRDENQGESQKLEAGSVALRANLLHGLPTEDGWRFRRPFDHFDAFASMYIDRNSFTSRSAVNLVMRGLLAGASYGEGVSSGLWGLWGAYDIISPGELRASTSALAFGTVKQWAPGPRTRLRGTAYLGAGFGAAGTNVVVVDKRDYHFGAQAVGLAELTYLWADRLRVRLGVREYVTGDTLSPDQGGYEDLTYSSLMATFRVYSGHCIGAELLGVRRDASYADVPDTHQKVLQASVTYSWVTEPSMGAGRSIVY